MGRNCVSSLNIVLPILGHIVGKSRTGIGQRTIILIDLKGVSPTITIVIKHEPLSGYFSLKQDIFPSHILRVWYEDVYRGRVNNLSVHLYQSSRVK